PVAPGPPRGAPEPRVSNTVTSAVSANTTSTSTRYATSLPLSPSAGALADLAVSAGRVGWARPGTVAVLRFAVPWRAVVPLPFAPVRVGGDPVAGAGEASIETDCGEATSPPVAVPALPPPLAPPPPPISVDPRIAWFPCPGPPY